MAKKLPADVQEILSAVNAGYHATVVKLAEPYLERNPDSQKGWLDYGHALAQLSRYAEAETAYQKAIQLAEQELDCDAIFGELGNLFRNQGDYDRAAECFQKQMEANPQDATGLLFLGSLELKRGNAQLALQTLQRCLDCESVCFEETHFALGCAHRSLGNLAVAKRQFELALQADPKYLAAKTALSDTKKALSVASGQDAR